MPGKPKGEVAMSNLERQKLYQQRKRLMADALRRIATEARTLTEARQIAAVALTG